MSEFADKDSKTEKPTSKRINDSFRKGTFPQSPEVGIAFTLLAGFAALSSTGTQVFEAVFNISSNILGNLSNYEIRPSGIEYWSTMSYKTMSYLVGPVLIASMVGGILAGGLQSGFKLTPETIKINWGKLNPVSGVKRLVSKDTLAKFGIDILKLGGVGLVMGGALMNIVNDPIFHSPVDMKHVGMFIVDTLSYVLWRLVIWVSLVAIVSYLWSKKKTTDDLKMTKEEVKQETKDQDMSPEVKQARMKMAMRLMQKQMLEDVPTADVVVTNPTHYAVALKYERGIDSAPMVLAKGENAFALRIKELAKKSGVPVVENKMVARMLYKVGQVGNVIPAEMYQSVAEILAFVYRTHKYYFHKLKAIRAAKRKSK